MEPSDSPTSSPTQASLGTHVAGATLQGATGTIPTCTHSSGYRSRTHRRTSSYSYTDLDLSGVAGSGVSQSLDRCHTRLPYRRPVPTMDIRQLQIPVSRSLSCSPCRLRRSRCDKRTYVGCDKRGVGSGWSPRLSPVLALMLGLPLLLLALPGGLAFNVDTRSPWAYQDSSPGSMFGFSVSQYSEGEEYR